MVIKYAMIVHCKTLQNLHKFGIFGLKTNHLATLPRIRSFQIPSGNTRAMTLAGLTIGVNRSGQ
jgi:hypothetical protein